MPREPEDIEDLEGEVPQNIDKSTETETTEEPEIDITTAPVQLG